MWLAHDRQEEASRLEYRTAFLKDRLGLEVFGRNAGFRKQRCQRRGSGLLIFSYYTRKLPIPSLTTQKFAYPGTLRNLSQYHLHHPRLTMAHPRVDCAIHMGQFPGWSVSSSWSLIAYRYAFLPFFIGGELDVLIHIARISIMIEAAAATPYARMVQSCVKYGALVMMPGEG